MEKTNDELKGNVETVGATGSTTKEQFKEILRIHKGPGILLILAIIMINAAVSVASVYVYDKYYAQKIATVDLQGYFKKVRQYVVEGKFNEEQYNQSVDKMEEAIVSTPKNTALITSDVALRNIAVINIQNPLFSQADEKIAAKSTDILASHKE